MTENRIPTEQELDALLDRQPPFNLEAVKVRTLSRIGEQAGQPAQRRQVALLVVEQHLEQLAALAAGAQAQHTRKRQRRRSSHRRNPLPHKQSLHSIVSMPQLSPGPFDSAR